VRDLPFRPAMRVRVSSLSPALCLITAAAGQDRLIAYPQDTWSYPTSDAAPLGSHPAIQTVEEGRWQALIPHTHLPTTPLTIVGFSVISETFGGPLTYRTLRVTLGHTSASALGTDFAANLIAPVAVIDRTNHAVNYRL